MNSNQTTTSTFKDLVAKDVRKESDDNDILILSSDFRSWLDELNVLLRDVELQLSAQKSRISEKRNSSLTVRKSDEWYIFKSSEDQWRLGALRFKASVEERIRSVKTLRFKQRNAEKAPQSES